jgi:hypothetical protein
MLPTIETLRERLLEKIEIDYDSGCWMWTESVMHTGYGRMWDGEKARHCAHRLSFELLATLSGVTLPLSISVPKHSTGIR